MNAQQVYRLRKKTGLTQQGFASLLGLSFVTVNRWENGRTEPVDLSLVILTLLTRLLEHHTIEEVSRQIRAVDPKPIELLRVLYRLESEIP